MTKNRVIRNKINKFIKIDAMEKMANYMIDNFCQEVVPTNLAEKFSFGSAHTAENYYSYMKQTFLFQGIHKFSFKSAQRIRGEKAYLVDVAFQSDREDTLTSGNLGFRLENIVYIELLRRYKDENINVFYYRDNFEVDFIIVDKTKVLELIQVTLDMKKTSTSKRELGGLYLFCLSFPVT